MEPLIPENEKRRAAILRHPHPELFEGLEPGEADRMFQYFFYTPTKLPARGEVQSTLKTRALKLKDALARNGRWSPVLSLEPYSGCTHGCVYCVAQQRLKPGERPGPARGRSGKPDGFYRSLRRDLRDLAFLCPPPMRLIMSVEADPLQESLETEHGVTENVLSMLKTRPERFTELVLRTKNPSVLLKPGTSYLNSLESFKKVTVEVLASFASNELRDVWEPAAPAVETRMQATRKLIDEGIEVVLRIDPLMPLEPLSVLWFKHKSYVELGCRGPGPAEAELASLLEMASSAGCRKVTVSPLYIPCGRGSRSPLKLALGPLFKRRNGRYLQQGGMFKLPGEYVEDRLIPKVRELSQEVGIHEVELVE